MKTRWLLFVVLYVLANCPFTRAGLYIPAEPAPWPLPAKPEEFRQKHGEYLSASSTAPSVRKRDFPKHVREQIAKLEKGLHDGKLSVDDSISLSGYYLLQADRAGHDKAINLLTPILQQHPRNFMVLANLANAYQGIGESRRAAELQQQVLANWPTKHPTWKWEQLWWYRRAEKYCLALLDSRNREKLLNKPQDTLDAIFPGLPSADGRDKFLIGEATFKMRDRLPPDVLPLVGQLLLWMPQDRRLLWMFAEVLNLRGDVALAWEIFQEIVKGGYANQFFRNHYRAYRAAAETDPRFIKPKLEVGGGGEPVFARPSTPEGTGQTSPGGAGQTSWLPDWRQLSVGFGTGLVVGILLLLQVRQLRRRFSGSPHAPSPG